MYRKKCNEVKEEMESENKAHKATANRIAQGLGVLYRPGGEFDIQTDSVTIEVETTATVASAIARLEQAHGKVYVALTNRDGVEEALRLTANTRVGVLDSKGEVVRECGERHQTSQKLT
ncbi:MAG: hypothetical protein KDB27_17460 [Planctomycetales bacterium]|nr:hypothetical protein [Planctomycetales bacterium]